MMSLEYCVECDEATGIAGIMDDSLYIGDSGPYCEECYEEMLRDMTRGDNANNRNNIH